MRPASDEAALGMQRHAGGFGAADHRDHLFEAERARRIDERGKQRAAHPPAHPSGRDVDAVLAGVRVSGAVAELGGVGVAATAAVDLGDQERPALARIAAIFSVQKWTGGGSVSKLAVPWRTWCA